MPGPADRASSPASTDDYEIEDEAAWTGELVFELSDRLGIGVSRG